MDNSRWTRQGTELAQDPTRQDCAARALRNALAGAGDRVPGMVLVGMYLGSYVPQSRGHWYGKSSPHFLPCPLDGNTFPAVCLTIGAWSYSIFNDEMSAHTNEGKYLHIMAEPDAFDGRELPPQAGNPVFLWYWTPSHLSHHAALKVTP